MNTLRKFRHPVFIFLLLTVWPASVFAAESTASSDPNTISDKSIGSDLNAMKEAMSKIYEYLVLNGLSIIYAIVILVVGRWLAKIISKLIGRAMERAKVDPTLIGFISNFSYIAMLVFVIIAAMAKVGIQTASFIAALGAAGLAVGFALQGSLSNFASGVLILIFKPLTIGDYVEVGGVAGTVKNIHIFNTVLNSPDNIRIIVPNSQITGGNIKNYTVNGTRRIDLIVGISYDDDPAQAKRIIQGILGEEKRLLPDPVPTVAVSELGDSSVNLVVRPWVKNVDYWAVRFDLIEKIKVTLDLNGITIPYPQRDVHIKASQTAQTP